MAQPTAKQWKSALIKLDKLRDDWDALISEINGMIEDWEPREGSAAEEKRDEIASAVDNSGQLAVDAMQDAINEIASAAGIDF